ncbi:MAG: ActS/PrrB/RegB family redox-sensitive histidine kinase [Alphaproteobacteria bacterium]
MPAADPRPDNLLAPDPQDSVEAFLPLAFLAGRGRLRTDTLVSLRWRGILGQAAVLAICAWGLGLAIPWAWCGPLVILAAALNLGLMGLGRRQRERPDWENVAVLAFDTLQLATLVFVTGGIANPFVFLLVAPIALAAAATRLVYVLGMVALGLACVVVLSLWAWPLPAPLDDVVPLAPVYRWGISIALASTMAFTANYAWRASQEAERMEIALNVAQQVLAREQRLSALGALAAAAAHELGTPLATIQVVSKELARGAAPGPLRDDAELLIEQAERCREILRRLTEAPEASDAMHERLTLSQLLNEVIEPHLGGDIQIEGVLSGPPGAEPPEVRRMPEILHAMTTLIENAADFAKLEVLVRARYDTHAVTIEVQDDGPGFAPEIIARLGQPYVTTRPRGEGSRSGHEGMGLGFFIAKTLLEKSGAVVSFHNGKRGGAAVAARWPRSAIEAPVLRDFST